jgi:hypothetical protein
MFLIQIRAATCSYITNLFNIFMKAIDFYRPIFVQPTEYMKIQKDSKNDIKSQN